MAHILTNDELNDLIERSWDELCRYAYENFLNCGRGFIGVDRTPKKDDYLLMYATVGPDSTLDTAIKTTVASYDPDTEMVLHFACAQNKFRTVRLKSQNRRGPESVWVEAMAQKGQQ